MADLEALIAEGRVALDPRRGSARHTRVVLGALLDHLEAQAPAPSNRILGTSAVARMLGVKAATVRAYRQRGVLPPPDGVAGQSPWWWEATIREWVPTRPGRGAGGGRPRSRP